jgi:tripartite ATP-independent transporter DctP family solute receptor
MTKAGNHKISKHTNWRSIIVTKIPIKLIAILITGFSLLLLFGCSTRIKDNQQVANNEKIVLKFSYSVDENTPKGGAARLFADLVRQRTGGYVEIQCFPNSSLVTDGQEFDALKNGEVQLLAPATSKLTGLFPAWQILDLPYAFPDLTSVHNLIDGPIGKKLMTELASQKFLGLAMWDNGFKQMTDSRRPLVQPQDFAGLNFRIMPSQVLLAQFAQLGAETSPIASEGVQQALQDRVVDGQENTISTIYSQRLDNGQKFMTISNHGYIGYVVLANSDFWASIPPRYRDILENTLVEVTAWERAKALELNDQQLVELKKQSQLQIYTLNTKEKQVWAKALHPVYDLLSQQLIADPDIVQAIKTLGANQ